jgi:hypothetical protein
MALTHAKCGHAMEDGTVFTWTVEDSIGQVSLTATRVDSLDPHGLFAEVAVSHRLFAAGQDGRPWCFGEIQAHAAADVHPGCALQSGWHEDCEVDGVVWRLAEPAWRAIAAGGVTDAAVRDELDQLHAKVFEMPWPARDCALAIA